MESLSFHKKMEDVMGNRSNGKQVLFQQVESPE